MTIFSYHSISTFRDEGYDKKKKMKGEEKRKRKEEKTKKKDERRGENKIK